MTIKEIMESFKPGSPAWEDAKTLTVHQLVDISNSEEYWMETLQPELNLPAGPVTLRPIIQFIGQIDNQVRAGFTALSGTEYCPSGRCTDGYEMSFKRDNEVVYVPRFISYILNELLDLVYNYEDDVEHLDEQKDIIANRLRAHVAKWYTHNPSIHDIVKSLHEHEEMLNRLEEVL